jgi:hypothetical protein
MHVVGEPVRLPRLKAPDSAATVREDKENDISGIRGMDPNGEMFDDHPSV